MKQSSHNPQGKRSIFVVPISRDSARSHHTWREYGRQQRCAGQRFLAPRGARPVCFTELGPPTPVVNSSKCPPNRPAPGNPHTRPARPRTDKSSDFPARPVDLTTGPAPPLKLFCVDIFSCFLLRVTQLMKAIDLSLRVRPHHFCRKKQKLSRHGY